MGSRTHALLRTTNGRSLVVGAHSAFDAIEGLVNSSRPDLFSFMGIGRKSIGLGRYLWELSVSQVKHRLA